MHTFQKALIVLAVNAFFIDAKAPMKGRCLLSQVQHEMQNRKRVLIPNSNYSSQNDFRRHSACKDRDRNIVGNAYRSAYPHISPHSWCYVRIGLPSVGVMIFFTTVEPI